MVANTLRESALRELRKMACNVDLTPFSVNFNSLLGSEGPTKALSSRR